MTQVVETEGDRSRGTSHFMELPLASADHNSTHTKDGEHINGGSVSSNGNNPSTNSKESTAAASSNASENDNCPEFGNSKATVRRPLDKGLPPASTGLPLTHAAAPVAHKGPVQPEEKLIHPALHKIPLQFRFGVNGLLSNLLFMFVYNWAVEYFDKRYHPSTIYSVVYFFFIPLSHILVSLFVFGWPESYIKSLMSNFPIGLTAIAIGSAMTAYLDQVQFNIKFESVIKIYLAGYIKFEKYKELYSSIVVLTITSIWTYALSVYINSPVAKSEKKEL